MARVLRLQSHVRTHSGYQAGKFCRVNANNPGQVRTVKVPALVYRAGGVAVAKEDMVLWVGDRICTGPATLMLIEFLIGGRVSLNMDAEVVVDSERSVADSKQPSILQSMRQSTRLREPLEILPTGVVFAVRG